MNVSVCMWPAFLWMRALPDLLPLKGHTHGDTQSPCARYERSRAIPRYDSRVGVTKYGSWCWGSARTLRPSWICFRLCLKQKGKLIRGVWRLCGSVTRLCFRRETRRKAADKHTQATPQTRNSVLFHLPPRSTTDFRFDTRKKHSKWVLCMLMNNSLKIFGKELPKETFARKLFITKWKKWSFFFPKFPSRQMTLGPVTWQLQTRKRRRVLHALVSCIFSKLLAHAMPWGRCNTLEELPLSAPIGMHELTGVHNWLALLPESEERE